jgi:hypothetical protein
MMALTKPQISLQVGNMILSISLLGFRIGVLFIYFLFEENKPGGTVLVAELGSTARVW